MKSHGAHEVHKVHEVHEAHERHKAWTHEAHEVHEAHELHEGYSMRLMNVTGLMSLTGPMKCIKFMRYECEVYESGALHEAHKSSCLA